MSNKIFRGIFLVALAVMIVCSAAVTALLYDYYSQVFKDHLKTEADFASAGVLISGESYLQGLAIEDRITLISKDGDVIFDNKADREDNGKSCEKRGVYNGAGRGKRGMRKIFRHPF